MRDEIPLAISDNDYVTFGSGFGQILVTCVGLLAALAMADSAPTVWMIPLGGLVLGIIALVFIGLANITSMIAIFYGMAVALRQGGGVWMHLPWRRLDQRALYDTSARASTVSAQAGTTQPLPRLRSARSFTTRFLTRRRWRRVRGLQFWTGRFH